MTSLAPLIIKSDNIEIRRVGRVEYSDEYIKLREHYWNLELEIANSQNRPLWNGTVCVLLDQNNSEDRIVLEISTCEYKDLVVRDAVGIGHITERFGKSHAYPYINVQCLIEDQIGNLIFGTQNYNNIETLVAVGGTLRTDEFKVESFSDIVEYAKDEIRIETNLESINNLAFLGICSNIGTVTFLFGSKLESIFDNNNSYLKRGEFHGEVIIKSSDLKDSKVYTFNERLLSVMPLIRDII